MASRGCQCTRTQRASSPSTSQTHKELSPKQKAFPRYSRKPSILGSSQSITQQQAPSFLCNCSFWARVAGTKELQNILSTFQRWSHLATLLPKETTKFYTITFPEKIPQVYFWKWIFLLKNSTIYSLKILIWIDVLFSFLKQGELVTVEGNVHLPDTKS